MNGELRAERKFCLFFPPFRQNVTRSCGDMIKKKRERLFMTSNWRQVKGMRQVGRFCVFCGWKGRRGRGEGK